MRGAAAALGGGLADSCTSASRLWRDRPCHDLGAQGAGQRNLGVCSGPFGKPRPSSPFGLENAHAQAVGLAPGNAEIVEEVERIRRLQEELHVHRSAMRAVGHLTEDGATPQTAADEDPAAQEVARCFYNLSSRARAVDHDAVASSSAEVDMHLQG